MFCAVMRAYFATQWEILTAFHAAQRRYCLLKFNSSLPIITKVTPQTAQGFDNYGSSLITLCSIKTGDGG